MKTLAGVPSRASSVTRWTGVPILGHRNNIAEHSFSVAFYCLTLHRQLNLQIFGVSLGNLLNYALIHDLPEMVTGDLPASIKQRVPAIKKLLDEVEDEIFKNELGPVNIEPDVYLKFYCKAADFICVKLELDTEIQLGNSSEPILEAVNVVKRIYNKLFYQDFVGKVPQDLIDQLQTYIESELGWMKEQFAI